MTLSEIGALVAGWLFGTLSPGIVTYIARPKRKTELLTAIAGEVHEVRYKLALVVDRARSRLGTLDSETLTVLNPVILQYKGLECDEELAKAYSQLLTIGETQYLALVNTPKVPNRTSLLPVPYHLPLLGAHISELAIFSLRIQSILLRIQAELDLYNEQVDLVRSLHNLTFTPSLSPENHAIVRSNILDATAKLATRAEVMVKTINILVDSRGQLLLDAR